MADIKLKNTANTEFSISHNGTRGAKAVTSDQIVVAVGTINDFPANPETGDTVIVKDNNRGGTFIYDATQSATNNGGTIFNGWCRQYSGAVTVKWFDGDIQLALDNYDDIFIPKDGTYNQGTPLSKVGDVRISSDGAVITDIGTSDTALLTLGGSAPIQISNISVDAVTADKSLTFASAQAVSDGDIILILNPTDSSWNNARFDYRAGEMVKVSHVVGNVVYLYDSLVDSYITTEVQIYKMNNAKVDISGFTVVANQVSTTSKAISLQYTTDASVVNMNTSLARHMSLGIRHCYNTTITDCVLENDKLFGATGINYGLGISNSHIVYVSRTYMYGVRHGLTTGGDDDFAVPCRYVSVIGCTVKSDELQSLDMHGNAEFFNFSNNFVENGINIGGDNHNVSGNIITGNTNNGGAIIFSEAIGLNYNVCNNIVNTIGLIANRGNFIDCQQFTYITRDSSLIINNNIVRFDDADASLIPESIYIYRTPVVTTNIIDITICNNSINSKTTYTGAKKAIFIRNTDLDGGFNNVNISNNKLESGYIKIAGIVETIVVKDNVINKHPIAGLYIGAITSDSVTISGNVIKNGDKTGIVLNGSAAESIKVATIKDNTLINNNVLTAGSSTVNSSLFSNNIAQLEYSGNFTGSPSSLQQRDYYAGVITKFYVGNNILLTGSVATISTGMIGSTTILTDKYVAADANDTITPSATYVQSEIAAIVTELHDLKNKMRAAGVLLT